MKKRKIDVIKDAIRRVIYVIGMIVACYGFWGSFFPDLTLVEGTYRIVEYRDEESAFTDLDAETLYADLLDGKYRITYSSKIWETIRNLYGHRNE